MGKQSAGILAYRKQKGELQVLLVHPGGPYHRKRDLGDWSIPKGEFNNQESALAAAKREFAEEIGKPINGEFTQLTQIKQRSSKMVFAFAVETAIDVSDFRSNTFEMEWPPRSGKMQSFPEVDKAEWFDIETAKHKILPTQLPLLEELVRLTVG